MLIETRFNAEEWEADNIIFQQLYKMNALNIVSCPETLPVHIILLIIEDSVDEEMKSRTSLGNTRVSAHIRLHIGIHMLLYRCKRPPTNH